MHVFGLVLSSAIVGCSGHDATVGTAGTSTTGSSSGSTDPGGTTPASGDGAALFAAPSGTATPDSIYGVWGGTTKSDDQSIVFDARLKLEATSATFATRCTLATGKVSGIVGVTVAARITDDDLVVLESKTDAASGDVQCSVTAAPKELKRCAADVQPGFEQDCFELSGTTLTQYGTTSLDPLTLVKLSD